MKDHMQYKNYYGSVHYNDSDEVFYGKVEGIKSLVSYEGTDIKSLKEAFQESVEDYLKTCSLRKIEPENPYKGSFNVRVGENLHRQAMEYAWSADISLNLVAKKALETFLKREQISEDSL